MVLEWKVSNNANIAVDSFLGALFLISVGVDAYAYSVHSSIMWALMKILKKHRLKYVCMYIVFLSKRIAVLHIFTCFSYICM